MTYIQPLLTCFLLLSFLGIWRSRSNPKRTPLMLLVGVGGLFLISWPPVAWLVASGFEAGYPRVDIPAGTGDVIVVLSGNVVGTSPGRPVPVADRDTYERCLFAAWLHKHWRPLPVLACGGTGESGNMPFAETMREVIRGEGVPDELIWTDRRSHSTYENAIYAAEVLNSKHLRRIVLVTEAYHMPRAERCFRKVGLAVVPAPCAFRSGTSERPRFLPTWKAVDANERLLHEALGFVWYRLRGWI